MATKVWEMTRAEKLEYLKETADNSIDRVTQSKANWRDFLKFYANLYTYPFSEVLTIQEQAPHFTACAEFKQWKNRGRGIHKGNHGIPVLDETTGIIKYFFDVTDTYGDERGLPNHIKLPEKYKGAIVNELRKRFNVSLTSGNDNNIRWAIEEYVRAESLNFMENLRYNIDGSYLADLDDDNIRMEFEETVVDSVGYLICERLEIDKGLYDDDSLSFQFLHGFNTRPALSKLGETVNHISQSVLSVIFETIKREQKLEETREKTNGRFENEQAVNRGIDEINEQPDSRGIGTESESGRRSSGDRQIRADVSGISESELSGTGVGIGIGNDIVGHLRESERRSDGNDIDSTGTVESEESASERGLQRDTSIRNDDTVNVGGNSPERDSLQVQIDPEQTNEAESNNSPLSLSPNIYYNSDQKPFDIGMGHLGNGLTVWNRLEERHGDYKTIAHISSDRTVKYYETNLPHAVKEIIEREARTSQMTTSTTQKNPVFSTPPQFDERDENIADMYYTPIQHIQYRVGDIIEALNTPNESPVKIVLDKIDEDYIYYDFVENSSNSSSVEMFRENFEGYLDNGGFRIAEMELENEKSFINENTPDIIDKTSKNYTFEYGGYHFTPYLQLVENGIEVIDLAPYMKPDETIGLSTDNNNYSHESFYNASPFEDYDVFLCEENGKLYVPSGYCLHEYGEDLHNSIKHRLNWLTNINLEYPKIAKDNNKNNNEKTEINIKEQPIESEAESKNTIPHNIYRALDTIAPKVLNGEYDYMRFQAGEGFMPLTFEHLSGNRFALMHYYTQNGDLMRDPDMEIVIDREKQTANAMSFTQHPNIYQEINSATPNQKLQNDLNTFLYGWLGNIKQQDYQPEIARYYDKSNDEEIEVYFNEQIETEAESENSPLFSSTDSNSMENETNLYMSRFEIVETSIEVFPDPNDAFAVWDELSEIYLKNEDGSIMTFSTEEVAEEYITNNFSNNSPSETQEKVTAIEVPDNGTFEYEEYHFTPYAKIKESELNIFDLNKYISQDKNMKISDNYSREEFYRTTATKECDVFLCEENGKLYIPAINGLLEYDEQENQIEKRYLPQIEKTPDPREQIYVGLELEIQGRKFSVDNIESEYGTVSMRDITFQNGTGFPIFRRENIDDVIQYLNDFQKKQKPDIENEKYSGTNADYEQSQDIINSRNIISFNKQFSIVPLGETSWAIQNQKTNQLLIGNDNDTVLVFETESEARKYAENNLRENGRNSRKTQDIDDGQLSLFRDIDDLPTQTSQEIENFTVEIKSGTESEKLPLSFSENITPFPNIPKPDNFKITDENFAFGSAKTKFARNIIAIRTLKQLEEENRYATPDEQKILSQYVGWGGMPQAFDSDNRQWHDEYTELKRILTDAEYNAAERSTLNAHYTSPEVIHGIYTALERMGFKGGNIIEPALGVGNFYGCMPDEIADNSRLYGVELDSITGRTATQLYPNANIQICGFQDANLQDNFFDAAISNVPFGAYKVNDNKFDKYGFLIHDYFFAKSLDKVRPGGIIAFVTSKGTLDKANTSVRRYIAERAELLGAIRLPNTAFKSNAGTEVTTDIIFLKKRDRIAEVENEKWIYTGKTDDGVPLNEYYLDNPQMMLGTMAFDDRMYGGGTETTLNPDERRLDEALREAVNFLPENIYEASINFDEATEDTRTIPADPNIKNFCYTVIGGEIYQRNNSVMEKRDFPKAQTERIKSLIELRVLTRDILDSQLAGINDAGLQKLQRELNQKYDAFVKKCGVINSKLNKKVFGNDADFPLLSALEDIDENGKVEKASIFTKRTITKDIKINHVDTAVEALPVCLNERGYLDIQYMADLANKNPEDIVNDLRGIIFKNPALDDHLYDENNLFNGWETADEYLSGRVKEKLLAAEVAAKDNPVYAVNVEYLKQVQPKPLEAHEISARIGAHWVDAAYYRQFLIETLKIPSHQLNSIKVDYLPKTGSWNVEKPYSRFNSIEAIQVHGTRKMDAYTLFELTLNQKSPRIYDTVIDKDGKEKRVLNHKETIAIREKQAIMKQEFKRWIFDDPDRRERLCGVYNNLFNSERPRVYDGSHLTFPGMTNERTLRDYQKNAVARILYGGNTLLAHEVGAGKTYTMAAAAMELKRIGMAKKPCFVVPNHLVGQWTNEFKTLYPTANILAATKKDFEKQNRKTFCARIATGEWDAVIIGHSSFEKVPISRERRENRLERDIQEVETALEELKAKDRSSLSVKDLQRTLYNLEHELKRLQDSKKDDVVTFEELGVDHLFVDEAHSYKNKFIFTKMNNVAGLSRARAKKSTDMDIKCEYINELNQTERGNIFATGTPISNSMVEMYTMQSYLQRQELERYGLHHFDNWAADFGEVVSALELAPSGQGYRVRERFAKFVGLPELMNMFGKIADIQTAEMLKLPVPEIRTGKPITIAVEPSPELKEYTQKLVKRAENIYKGVVKSDEDNMLCVTGDGRKAALDMRIIDPNAEDYPDSKVNTCAKKVFEIYEETKAKKSAQMIFCDTSTPKSDGSFNVYHDIREKLLYNGVKESEIAFIHDADTDEKKEKLFAKVRSGEVRILIGSTQKMGAGTNAQTRLIALHHLDCPYRPSDLMQRNGRIVRQKNENPEVQIYQYVTKQSFDAYLWQIVESKAKFIGQIMSGKNPSREMEDLDETVLNYGEVKAIASGNPLIKLKLELEIRLQTLQTLEAQHRSNKYRLENAVLKKYPQEITNYTETIKNYEADIVLRNKYNSADFNMTIAKTSYEERKDAGDILLKLIQSNQYNDKVIGVYKGFKIIPQEQEYIGETPKVWLKGALTHSIDLSDDPVGSIMRIENRINKDLEKKLEETIITLSEIEKDFESAKIQLTKPFEQEDELKEITAELSKVNMELDIDRSRDDVAAVSDEENDDENDENEDFENEETDEDDFEDEL